MATTRFVYPIYNYRKKMLQIQREDEDGYCWPLGMQGLSDYLSEQGLDIENVEWHVAVHPKDWDYATIKATSVKDWFDQFNNLKVEFDDSRDKRFY